MFISSRWRGRRPRRCSSASSARESADTSATAKGMAARGMDLILVAAGNPRAVAGRRLTTRHEDEVRARVPIAGLAPLAGRRRLGELRTERRCTAKAGPEQRAAGRFLDSAGVRAY